MLLQYLLPIISYVVALEHFLPHDTFGSAKVYSDLISLNPRVSNQAGAVWAQKPNQLKEWTLDVKLRVNGPEHGGKGLAIWGKGGAIFGSVDNWDGLGLFLSAEPDGSGALRGYLNDRSMQFAKLESTEKMAFGSCTFNYRNLGTISSIKISYNDKSLKVTHDDELCFENFDVSLPTGLYHGVSAAAAELADSHELFGLEVTSQSHISGTRREAGANVPPARAGFPVAEKDPPAALDSAMQRIITKLIADSDKMSSRVEELTHMKSTVDRIESAISLLKDRQNELFKPDSSAAGSKAMHEDLTRQIQRMEDKFMQMEKHIEKQTDHIVASLPPVEKPLRTAVYVLIFVQLVICGAYIMYRRRTEEKSKFL